MQSFKDKNGRVWTFDLNISTWRRVKSETGFDLADISNVIDGKTTLDRLAEPVALMEVLYVLCVPPAERASMTGEGFMELMNMESVESAAQALMEDIANFSPPAARNLMMKLLKSSQNYNAKKNDAVTKILNDPNLDEQLDSIWNASFPNLPE